MDGEIRAMPSTINRSQPSMSRKAFAMLGTESVAYVRAIRSEDVGFMYAEAPLLAPGHVVFVLHAADGRPLAIAESLETALADAGAYQLETVSVH
jgi:hypothetical protein